MGLVQYLCRIIPGVTIILWTFICWQALSGRLAWPWSDPSNTKTFDWHHLDVWQILYIVFSVIQHVFACLVFPLRLVYSIWQLTDEVRRARFDAAELSRQYDTESETASSIDDKSSALSIPISSASTLAGTPEANSRVGTPKLGCYFDSYDSRDLASVTHAIILPAYKEDIGTLRETLLVLSSHCLARSSYCVFLAMEERDPHGVSTAKVLIEQFQNSFKDMTYTIHPSSIVGEIAGKSSNVAFAARQVSLRFPDPIERRNVIITVSDADSHFSENYYILMAKSHIENPTSDMAMYTCPLIFDRNSHQVNFLVRSADVFWCGAGISGMYRGSSILIPTSVYSIALPLASSIGGFDSGPESIGEDMHTYLKVYFATKGRADVILIPAPTSQCNVSVNSKGLRGFVAGVHARIQQAIRHMWGCLDTGYAAHRGLEAFFKVENTNATWASSPEPETRLDAWVASVESFDPPHLNRFEERQETSFSPWKLVVLAHRLLEAHQLPTLLTVALFSAVIYSTWVPDKVTHPLLVATFTFCGTLRFIGLCLTCCYLYLYESYHKICVKYREDDMKRAGLYEDLKANDGFSHRSLRNNWMDYLCLPAIGMFFGTIPAVIAMVKHFWTDELTYKVSAKPLSQRMADKIHKAADSVGNAAGAIASTADIVADKVKDKLIDHVA